MIRSVCTLALLLFVGHATRVRADELVLTHGPFMAEVSSHEAMLWARVSGPGELRVLVGREGRGLGAQRATVTTHKKSDYTVSVALKDLEPNARYEVVLFVGTRAHRLRFRSARPPDLPAPVRFAWGGDVGGQNVCRDATRGMPVFERIRTRDDHFFVALGDMIYADGTCQALGQLGNAQVPGNFEQAASLEAYWAHWKYNREDGPLRSLLRARPSYAVWDDHEVVNDFGPLTDVRSHPPYTATTHLMPIGLSAFLHYNPIASFGQGRLFRSVRHGKHVELFLLDTRQYRDASYLADSDDKPKTMLGEEQRAWFKRALKNSDATWKIVVSSVPLSIPTGREADGQSGGYDGWANLDQDTGYERELVALLEFAHEEGIKNLLFITTDVHFAAAFRYRPFSGDPSYVLHELVSGPLNAGLGSSALFDTSLGTERLFYHAKDVHNPPLTWEQAARFRTFGTIAVSRDGHLEAGVENELGERLYSLALTPQ